MKSKLALFLALCLMVSLFAVLPASAATVKLVPAFPANGNNVTVGFTIAAPTVTMSDATTALPADVTFSWTPKSALSYDEATKIFTAKKTGTITITAKSATLGSKANGKCKLYVKKNQYTNPVYKGNGTDGIFFGVKKIYFKGASMYFEISVYNNISQKRSLRDLVDIKFDVYGPLATTPIASFSKAKWVKTIGYHKSATITLKGPRLTYSQVLDLRNPTDVAKLRITPSWGGFYHYFVAKGVESKAVAPKTQAPQGVLQLLR